MCWRSPQVLEWLTPRVVVVRRLAAIWQSLCLCLCKGVASGDPE